MPLTLTFNVDFLRPLSAALVSASKYVRINFKRNTKYVMIKKNYVIGKKKVYPVYLSRLGFRQSHFGPLCLEHALARSYL